MTKTVGEISTIPFALRMTKTPMGEIRTIPIALRMTKTERNKHYSYCTQNDQSSGRN